MQTETGLVLRPGTLDDLAAVTELCKKIWGGHDYVPRAWASWLADPDERVYVLEEDGRLAGFHSVKVKTDYSIKSGWWHGVRVDPDFRGRGLARRMVAQAIEVCQQHYLDKLFYATNIENYTMHRLGDEFGFRYVTPYSYLTCDPDKTDESFPTCRVLTAADADSAWQFVQSTTSWKTGEGTYCDNWVWKNLEREVIEANIQNGRVHANMSGSEVEALVIVDASVEEGEDYLMATYIEGQPDALAELARYIRYKLVPTVPNAQYPGLNTMLVEDSARDAILVKAGFISEPSENMRLYERLID